MEVYKMLPEGTLAELINGILYMSPAPKTNHQRIIFKIGTQITNFIEQGFGGEIFIAPCDVYLDQELNAVQPDVLFISKEKSNIVLEDGIYGSPDFIVEVLSPSNSKNDLEVKKELYERFLVKEYWIVDPIEKKAIGYSLQLGKFVSLKSSEGIITSPYFNQEFKF